MENPNARVDENRSTHEPDDPLIPGWVKTAAAIAGVLATLSTIFLGFRQLAQQQNDFQVSLAQERAKETQAAAEKARADAEVEQSKKEEERIRLDTANLIYRQHTDDIREAKNTERDKEEQASASRLSELISRVFAVDHTAEGDLAQLSEFVSEGSNHRTAVLNALAAKLANPRSVGEVHVAFRLIGAFGPDASGLIIDSNRVARQQYNQVMTLLFWTEVRSRLPVSQTDAPTILDAAVPLINDSYSALDLSTLLNKHYQMALLNQTFHDRLGSLLNDLSRPNDTTFATALASKTDAVLGRRDPSAEKEWRSQAIIQAAILTDSVAAIENMLRHQDARRSDPLDFSNCYLAGLRWPHSDISSVDFDNAYIGGADFSSAKLDQLSHQSLDGAMGVGFYNLDDDRASNAYFRVATHDNSIKFPSAIGRQAGN